MAKQTLKLSKFSGGINTVDSNRALVDDQTPFAKNCDVSKEGRIGILGNALTSYGNVNDSTSVADPGYGLFVFSHDYDMLQNGDGNAGALKTPENISTTYICKATTTGVSVYDKHNGFWYANLILFDDTDNANDPLPIFYMADGALRVCDANSPDDAVKWLGHIKRSLFGTGLQYNGWFSQNAELSTNTIAPVNSAGNGAPLHVTLRHNAADDEFPVADSATVNIFTTWVEDTSDTALATWSAGGSYEIWASGIYDTARQEGPLVSIGQMGTPPGESGSSSLKLGIDIDITGTPANVLNPRMIGLRIYYSNNLDAVETAYQLVEVDFVKGVKKSGGTDYTAFGNAGNVYSVPSTIAPGSADILEFIDPPFAATYDAKNGHYSSEETKIAFKTAVVVGRRVYAGNIAFQKETSGNTFKSDQMVKSAFNQFDKFPEFNSSTTAVNDGDDIVALVDVGDQLLQFKRTSLYVLDITETGEAVNAKHDFRGISRPCHVTKTPMGVMWINETGLHLYGEGKIQNLITGKISTEVWNFSDNMSLGYNDEFSKIIVAKDVNIYNSVTNPDAGDALVFDLKSMSWMEGGKILSDIGNKTNFQTTPEGDIIYAVDGTKTGYLSTTGDVTFKFFGKLKKYSTAFSSQAWEQSQYPWKLLPNDDSYTDGNRDVAPFQGVERTIIDWQNDNHFITTAAWTADDNAQYSEGTPEFLDYDRFSISYKDPTTGAEDVDGNLMFGGYLSVSQDPTSETFYCVPIAVNGNIGTDVTNLSICPAGKTSLGTTLNRLREVVGSVMANNTLGSPNDGVKTFDDMIDATEVNATFAAYAVHAGAVWSISLDAPGNTDIDDVAFSLSVTIDPVTDLTVTGASILKWSNQPVNSENFRYYTRDIDFGSSSAGKRISKTYITYRSVSSRDALDDVPIPTNSNVHPMLHLTTDTGLYTVLPDESESTNYSTALGLLGDTNDWMKSTIKWEKTDINDTPRPVPSVIQSAQLVLYRDPALNSAALVVGGFEISDISFSFRMKTVK